MEIHTVDDLIRILREHPQWRDRLRDALFTEEEKQIPDRLRRVEEALDRLTQSHERALLRLDRLEESHQQALARLDRLEASVERLWGSHQQLLQEVRELRAAVERLTGWLEKLDTEVGKWRGYTLELRFHQRASAILGLLREATACGRPRSLRGRFDRFWSSFDGYRKERSTAD